jgi:hypothetical protein
VEKREQVNEIIDYAIARLEKAKKYGLDMSSSTMLCLEDAREHVNNAMNVQSLVRAEK